jgi:adenine phosphoribosyltransferase
MTDAAGPHMDTAAPLGGPASALADRIRAGLREVPDFPQPGILFKDIAPLLADAALFGDCVRALAELADGAELIAGVEARGFLVAGALARELGCGLVPIRKAGKLPPPTIRREYVLEYGTATIEVPVGVLAEREVFVVDDVLATGGTLRAAVDLVAEAGAHVIGMGVLLEIAALGGAAHLADSAPLQVLLRD